MAEGESPDTKKIGIFSPEGREILKEAVEGNSEAQVDLNSEASGKKRVAWVKTNNKDFGKMLGVMAGKEDAPAEKATEGNENPDELQKEVDRFLDPAGRITEDRLDEKEEMALKIAGAQVRIEERQKQREKGSGLSNVLGRVAQMGSEVSKALFGDDPKKDK